MNRNPIFLIATIIITFIVILLVSYTGIGGDLIMLFKDEQGKTNWQYVANWSSGILIILLSFTAIILFLSRLAKLKTNKELVAIKLNLEHRVVERTQQLHDSEHYLQSILESMPSMLVGLDSKGVITQWNKKAEKYTGVKMMDAIGHDLWEAYPIITISRDQVDQALIQQHPTTIRQSQRGLFHFDITIYPLTSNNSKGSVMNSGVVLLLDDVSKQVKSENQLIQRDKMSSMGELASSMAHDMSVPLQGMLNDIKQIEKRMLVISEKANTASERESGNKRQYDDDIANITSSLTDAVNLGNQATSIVDNLLDFASAQRKEKQEVEMTQIMDHTIKLAETVLSTPKGLKFTDISIKREYDENLPSVSCHVSEIQQVFLSLLRHCLNALASAKGDDFKPVIKIRVLQGYNSLWLQISHNGVGLNGDEQQSIFEPFFSNDPLDMEDDAHKRLSFPHFVITEHHDAHMAVTSDVKVGTTFHIQFQLV
ncbi:MAG: PAS domain-containing sensor histidine kinase [Kangiella sp.]|nr:MAG: PAS domain-containing sensor histidine kinase [Kangiella sp.]